MTPAGLITSGELALRLGIAAQTLAVWRLRGIGPRFLKLGSRVMYDPQDVSAWLNSRRRESTSDDGART